MEEYTNPRHFRIWQYYVSFSQLILRSPKSESMGINENIDLMFYGVFYIELPTFLDGIEIREVAASEVNLLEEKTGVKADESHKYYEVKSNNKKHYIGAAFMNIDVNELEPLQTKVAK